jgi:Uma2 family endonuclease
MEARAPVRYKADYIWETPDDGNRYEVIDGVLYVTPPPSWLHQRGLSQLHIRVGRHVYDNDLGELVEAPVGVVLDEHSGLQPDIVYISRERLAIIAERGVEGAPDLVVEMLSPSTRARDRGVKMRRYAAAEVHYFWIGDPRSRTIEEYRLVEGTYEQLGVFGPGMIFRPQLFPGLEIPIDEIWD